MEELTDHVRHVGWKDQEEEAQGHGSEVLPQAPVVGKEGFVFLFYCMNSSIYLN